MNTKTGFVQQFEKKVKNTVREHRLANKKDKIIVACSGGKDSTTTLYLLDKFGYKVEALIIDLLIGEWSEKNLENLKEFCKKSEIKLHVINMRKEFGCSICYIRAGIQEKAKLKNCTICGVVKRWLMNKKARELGATKLATGHNLDDEAETLLMNLFTGNPELTCRLGPKGGLVKNKKFVQRIKPLYLCTNAEIRRYSKKMKFPVLYDPCPCSTESFRREVRNWLAELEKRHGELKTPLVENFLEILPALRKNCKQDKGVRLCKTCGEPSKNEICKRCKLIKIMRVDNA